MLILTSEQNLWKMSGGCSAKIHPNANDPVRCPCRDKRFSGFIVLQKQEPSVTPSGALGEDAVSNKQRYRVHIYAIVRVPVEVEAKSKTDAIKRAEEQTNLYSAFRNPDVEYAEEVTEYLVDECDDPDHKNSRRYENDGVTPWTYREVED